MTLVERLYLFAVLSIVAAVVLTLAGCAPAACIKPAVTLTEPVLPTVKSSELECLTADVYERLALRDLELQGALRECRAIVEELSE